MALTTPSKVPLPMGDLDLHLIRGCLGNPNLLPKWHLDQFCRFCTAHGRISYTLQWAAPFSPKVPLLLGVSGPYLIHGFLGPSKSATQMASRLVQPFLQDS